MTKTDERAADRLLSKAVSIARVRLTLAKTDPQYRKVFIDNVARFQTAIEAAAFLVEEPVS